MPRLVNGYTSMEDFTRDLTHIRYAKSYWIRFEHELDRWIDRQIDTILKIQKQPTRWPTPPFEDSPLYNVLQTMKQLFYQGNDIRQITETLQSHDEYTMHRVVGNELKLNLNRANDDQNI